jgi:hypothetical protein
MKYKILSIINLVTTIAVISWNYYINAVGINGLVISDLSRQYENLFTPASYAFSIWGIIFLGLIALSLYYCYLAFSKNLKEKEHNPKILKYLIIANILNGLWSYFFISQQTGISIVAMFGILLALIICIVGLRMEKFDADPKTIIFIWWPISFYIGWISVAAIANVASHLSRSGFNTVAVTDYQYTVIMIVIATIINVLMIYYRNMREFGLVGVWSLVAIYIRHTNTEFSSIADLALVCAVIISVAILVHGYKKRNTNIFKKIQES